MQNYYNTKNTTHAKGYYEVIPYKVICDIPIISITS